MSLPLWVKLESSRVIPSIIEVESGFLLSSSDGKGITSAPEIDLGYLIDTPHLLRL
jgi:hypothetical protein